MSRLRKYPGDSEEPPKDPFADEAGRNLFADRDVVEGETAEPAEAAGPYASAAGGGPAHRVGGFQATLPHRGGMLLITGICGALGAAAGLCFWPLLIANLLLTLPAWLMSQSDLRAMQAGAMDPSGRGMTQAAHILGIVGTLATLIPFIVLTWRSFRLSGLW
jgi:hypothetical protein